MFSPAYGVAEDAATGSAAGPLAIHLGRHGFAPFGRPIEIMQGVEMGRPSRMLATATLDPGRIEVAGAAVIVARGSLLV
jgi:trans-2,3-dihydro-3-hydroxyanthranilate isomerase